MPKAKKYSEKQLDAIAAEFNGGSSEVRAAKKKNFCEVYQTARPFMEKAKALLSLVKPSWAKTLDGLMESLDDACPAKAVG